MTEAPTILIIDDDVADRLAVRRALAIAEPSSRLEEAEDAASGLERLLRGRYLCAFIDHRLPDGSGLTLVREAIHRGVLTPMVILTGFGDELLAVEAIKSGASDYLPKAHLNADRVRRCLDNARALLAAEAHAREERDWVQARIERLTPREREIMEMLVAGRSNKSVAAELGISRRTVETHRARIMDKMQVRSLADLVHRVLTARNVPPPGTRHP